MNLAIFLPNWVGDLVMATPTLRAVRRHFGPSARIVGILRPQLAELLDGSDWLDEQFPFDPKSGQKEHGRLALIGRMRRQRFDMALLLTNSLHTAALAWLGGARQRVGYARDGRSWFLTRPVPAARDGRQAFRPAPMVESYLALARAIGCPEESPQLELNVTAAESASGRAGMARFGAAERRTGRGAELQRGLWGGQTLAGRTLRRAGPADRRATRSRRTRALRTRRTRRRPPDRRPRRGNRSRVFSLAAQAVSLGLTKGCLARCRLMVSTDSGPRHIAAALGKPVVTLLGPTLPAWIENPSVRGSMLRAELDCLGCGKRTCPLGHHRCMRDLTPERVLREVAALVQTTTIKAA